MRATRASAASRRWWRPGSRRTARPEPVEGRACARGSTSSPRAERRPTQNWREGSIVAGAEEARLRDAVHVLFEVLDALGGDGQRRVVAARDEPLLGQKPDRELEVLAGAADQRFDVENRDRRLARLGAPARVEQLEQRQPRNLFGANIHVAVRAVDHL